jgi:hypothetical protein
MKKLLIAGILVLSVAAINASASKAKLRSDAALSGNKTLNYLTDTVPGDTTTLPADTTAQPDTTGR